MLRRTLPMLAVAFAVGATALIAPPAAEAHAARVTIRVQTVYDPWHHDYHRWDARERHEYREYLAERHERYRAYERQRAAERRAYWHWRHERLEHERWR